MNKHIADFDVSAYLSELKRHFDEFDGLTAQLANMQFNTDPFNQTMDLIRNKTDEIVDYQGEYKPEYERFLESGSPMPPQAKALAKEVQTRLSKLIGQYDAFQEEAREARTKLLPVVNDNIRSVQMKSAYGRHSS